LLKTENVSESETLSGTNPFGTLSGTDGVTPALWWLFRPSRQPSKQLLARLDNAIASATIDDVYVDEANTPES
jgi:hypothetical protein